MSDRAVRDLSPGSIGWHRVRQWLDSEMKALRLPDHPVKDLTESQLEYLRGLLDGQMIAYMKVRPLFNTEEESHEAEVTRREMFG